MIAPIKKERIFRVLSTQENLTITKISEQTKLAKSYVSKVVNELKKKGIIFGAEKIHVNYDKLIREWGILKRKIFESMQPLIIDILIPDRLKLIIKNYAISGPFVEMLVQGESSGKPIIVYISEEEMEKRKSQIYKLGSIEKGFAHIYVYDEDILRYKWEIKGWKIVSIPQLCADLIAEGMFADLGIKLFERWLNAGRRI
jgi:DNA-binding Lrp family transcriptional regulator